MNWDAIKAGGTTSIILILAYVIYVLVSFIVKKKFRNNHRSELEQLEDRIIHRIGNDLKLEQIYPLLESINKGVQDIKNNTYDIKNVVDRIDEKLDKLNSKIDDRFEEVYRRLGKLKE